MATVREDKATSAAREERQALEQAERLLAQEGAEQGTRLVGPDGAEVTLTAALVRVLRDATRALAEQPSATVVVAPRELTTQQAAELLSVSRPYLVEHLLAAGEIPYTMTGTHRRLALDDVLAYRQRRDAERRRRLDALAQMSQEMGLDRE